MHFKTIVLATRCRFRKRNSLSSSRIVIGFILAGAASAGRSRCRCFSHALHFGRQVGSILEKQWVHKGPNIGPFGHLGKAVHVELSAKRSKLGVAKVAGNHLLLKQSLLRNSKGGAIGNKRGNVITSFGFQCREESMQLHGKGFVTVRSATSFRFDGE